MTEHSKPVIQRRSSLGITRLALAIIVAIVLIVGIGGSVALSNNQITTSTQTLSLSSTSSSSISTTAPSSQTSTSLQSSSTSTTTTLSSPTSSSTTESNSSISSQTSQVSETPISIPAKTPQSLSDIPPSCDAPTGCAYHWHVHLDIFVNASTYVIIPPDLGNLQGGGFYAIHTHDSSGIVHLEAPLPASNFTLQQVFEVWGYPQFDSSDCLTFHNQPIAVYVNGTLWSQSPIASIPLTQHVEIAIVIGAQAPSYIPSSYQFPAGE